MTHPGRVPVSSAFRLFPASAPVGRSGSAHPRRTRRRPTRLALVCVIAAGLFASGLAALPADAASAAPVSDPASYVVTTDGTGNGRGVGNVSEINNFPGATVPFGMVQFSPDTTGSATGYIAASDTLTGFSATHIAAGCTAMGDFPLLPAPGTTAPTTGDLTWNSSAKYTHENEIGQAGYYSVRMPDAKITAELTASSHTGIARFSYDDAGGQVIIRSAGSKTGNPQSSISVDGPRTVSGSATTDGFCGDANRANSSYKIYFALSFDRDISTYGTFDGSSITPGITSAIGANSSQRTGAYVTFDGASQVEARMSISYVSVDNARSNLRQDVDGKTFDQVRQQAKSLWNESLGRIAVSGGTDDDKRSFYTSLYRGLLHPSQFSDLPKPGADVVEYRGWDRTSENPWGAVHTLPIGQAQYANFSDWDTYRTLAPLQAMLFPKRASQMAQSLVRDAEQSGALPRWAIGNGASGQMTGDSVTTLLAQYYFFGARERLGDSTWPDTALSYMQKAATSGGQGLNGYVQRRGAELYSQLGYGARGPDTDADHEISGTSITLEWSVADFAISRLAAARPSAGVDPSTYQTRSNYWQNVFDPAQQTFASRGSNGQFLQYTHGSPRPFSRDGFDEGTSEQYLWMVPTNMEGLAKALGGRDRASARLESLVPKGASADEEARILNAGDTDRDRAGVWLGNEPGFLTPWAFNYFGAPSKTQELVDRMRVALFGVGRDSEPGNDDLGATASVNVWAMLGVVPATPATTYLTVSTPVFDETVISLGNGKEITLSAPNASSSRYIAGMTVNGQASDKTYLPESLVSDGGRVDFQLAPAATSWGTAPDSAPPSFDEGSGRIAVSAGGGIPVDVAPGSSATVTASAQSLGGAGGVVTAQAVDLPEGVSSAAVPVTFGSTGAATVDVEVAASSSARPGVYAAKVRFSDGTVQRDADFSLAVGGDRSVPGAYNIVTTARDSRPGEAAFDSESNLYLHHVGSRSYSREALAAVGLTPGAAIAVLGGLTAVWPNSQPGQPDTIQPDGQQITMPSHTDKVSLVGSARNGSIDGVYRATLSTGATVDVPYRLGDWVGGTTDSFGTMIAESAYRVQKESPAKVARVFSTTPYTAPQGTWVTSITLLSEGNEDAAKLRVFTVASHSQATPTTVSATPATDSVTSGGSVEVAIDTTGGVAGSVTVREGDAIVAGPAATTGSTTVSITPQGVGDHRYTVDFTPSDSASAASTSTFSITATPATSTLKADRDRLRVEQGADATVALTVSPAAAGTLTAAPLSSTSAMGRAAEAPTAAGRMDASGHGTLSLPASTVGSVTYRIEFTPDGAESTSASATVVVEVVAAGSGNPSTGTDGPPVGADSGSSSANGSGGGLASTGVDSSSLSAGGLFGLLMLLLGTALAGIARLRARRRVSG